MNPLWVIAVPLALIIIGMVLNSVGLAFDQPESSTEQDPVRRMESERQAYRTFFDRQRKQALTRQKRVGQYSWLVLAVFIAAFWWMYVDTVNKSAGWNQIATIQTVPVAEGTDLVLSVTLKDGSNVKYLVKPGTPAAAAPGTVAREGFSKESVPKWETSRLATALSSGDQQLPLGVALTIAN
ncbi:MAG TPA: hypothetical protein VGA73_09830 [Candidatus Binatia bacterium]